MTTISDNLLQNSKIALVLANGPSAKLIDFKNNNLGSIATVGMNSAFRFWKKIDFRPIYYICMDIEVTQTIADDIVGLIKENRIHKFFLRDEIKALHPEIANNERIYWYSQAVIESEIFDSTYVTTGSWAIRWMLHEGMRLIATIGIDGIQNEILTEAKRLGSGSDLRLQIVNTPKFNPNYFFSDYQQAGDKYNIPNSPEYLKNKGSLFHVDALKAVSEDINITGIKARIVDLSPISNHGIFEKLSYDAFLHKIQLTLVTSFYVKADSDVLVNNVKVAIKNCNNPFISSVHILLEGDRDKLDSVLPSSILNNIRELGYAGKLYIVPSDRCPSYKNLFDYGNSHGMSFSCIIANCDIVFPFVTTEKIVIERYSKNQPIYALTRWNSTTNGYFIQGSASVTPPWNEINLDSLTLKEKNYLSFDAYIFDRPLQVPALTEEVFMGSFGCDTALIGIFRAYGYVVSNPCLSCKTIHFDEKSRDYDKDIVNADVKKNIEVVKASILMRYSTSPNISKSLVQNQQIDGKIAWIGDEKTSLLWRNLFRVIGLVQWSLFSESPVFKSKKIIISRAELEVGDLNALELIREMEEQNIFLEWELSGFNEGGGISTILRNINGYENLGEYLASYPWQSMIYTDQVSPEVRMIYSDFLLVIYDLLSAKTNGNLIDNTRENDTFKFTKIYVYGDVTQHKVSFTLTPPSKDNHICCGYAGAIRSGSFVVATVEFTVNHDCTLYCMLCRDGSKNFESTSKVLSYKPGRHKLILTHRFKQSHRGARIQIGAVDRIVSIINIKSELRLNTSSNYGIVASNIAPGNGDKKQDTYMVKQHVRPQFCGQDVVDGLFILDPDGKNIRGHFLAYCDQLMTACSKANIKSKVWCRSDIEPSLLISRPNYYPMLKTHSWTIATNENTFFSEIEEGLNQYAISDKQLVFYLYTGSLYHARVFLKLSQKFPHVQFNCNLFWEMIRNISTREYEKLGSEVLNNIQDQRKVIITVPTVRLQSEIAERFGVKLEVAPHPSTAVSDDLFMNIQEITRTGSLVNVFFPGAATQNKGYDISLEMVRTLSIKEGLVCWMRDEKKGEIPLDVRIIPDNLTATEFIQLIQSSDILVLPYMPEGFSKRTSGILIDAMYFGIPVVVCAGTWLGDFVVDYKFGIVAQPTSKGLTTAVMMIKDNLAHYRKVAREGAKLYFHENSWSKLLAFLLPMKGGNNSLNLTYHHTGQDRQDLNVANKLFRNGEYATALDIYIQLYELRKLQMYEYNAMMCAKKMGLAKCNLPSAIPGRP